MSDRPEFYVSCDSCGRDFTLFSDCELTNDEKDAVCEAMHWKLENKRPDGSADAYCPHCPVPKPVKLKRKK